MSERRRHERQSIDVPLHVRAVDNGVSRWVEARDVSDEGLSFETRRSLNILDGAPLYLDNLGGEVPDAARVEARVVHAKHDEDTGRFRVGVRFTGRSRLTEEQLKRRIKAWKGEDSN